MPQLNTYLEKFSSTIPATQSRQVVAILQEYRRRGQIKTLEQFKTRFADLTAHLQQQVIQPSLQLFLGEYRSVIDSETYNYMMDRIRDDLITAFVEADNIDEILDTHHQLITKIIFGGIRLALNELEKKITIAEILNQNTTHSFDNAQAGITNGVQVPSTDRRDPNAGVVFSDPVLGGTISSTAAHFGGITLGSDSGARIKVKAIRQVSSAAQADVSAFNISLFPDNANLYNLLDGKPTTYWETSVLSQDVIPGGAYLQLELELPAKMVFNTLFIEPATDKSVTLEAISVLGPNNTITSVYTDSTVLSTNVEIRFKPQVSSKVYLLFHQKTYSVLEFAIQDGRPVSAFRNELDLQIDQATLDRYLGDLVQTDLLRSVVGTNAVDRAAQTTVRWIEYQFILDNICLSQTTEAETSVFVSAPLVVATPSAIGLEAQETRPVKTSAASEISYDRDTGQIVSTATPPLLGVFSGGVWADAPKVNDSYQASVEYWIRKIDRNGRGTIISVATIPILPLGSQLVLHERFLPTQVPVSLVDSVGKLRFYCELPEPLDIQTLSSSDNFLEKDSNYREVLRVYRNGTELPPKDEFDTDEDGWALYSQISSPDNLAEPMATYIQIENPSNTDRYTVSYVPKQSNTLFLSEDNEGSSKIVTLTSNKAHIMGRDNIIFCRRSTDSDEIDESTVYLTIILRKNTATKFVAPTVREYILYTGSTRPEKLNGFE